MSSSLTETSDFIKQRLKNISDILPHIAACDFSKRLEVLSEDDPFIEVYVGINCLIEDLLETSTSRKLYEKALIKSENQFRKFFEESPVYCYMISPAGIILNINKVALKTLGYKKDEIIGKPVNIIYPKKFQKKIEQLFKKWKVTGRLRNEEIKIITKKGEIRDVLLSADTIKDENGKILHSISVQQDITYRKQAETALIESEEKYRNLFDLSPEAVILMGLDGTILDCNVATEKVCGIKKANLIGSCLMELDIFDEVTIERLVNFLPKAFNEKIVVPFELALQVNGDIKWVEAKYSLLKKENEPFTFQVIVRDITMRKRNEDEMKRRLMKFNIEDGEVYLVQEPSPTISIEAFKDLLKIGYHGFIISRTPERDLKRLVRDYEFEFLWLAEKDIGNTVTPKLENIEKWVGNLFRDISSRKVILINGLDYIIFKNNFKNTLAFIQRIRELSYFTGNIVIISFDKSTLYEKELKFLKKEGNDLEHRVFKKKLPDDLFKIIKFIYEDNIIGNKPSYTKIGQELGLSKPTVRKRLRILNSAGYISEDIKGRKKVVILTEIGKNTFFTKYRYF
jgi:PAS domain S-box-containing protein